MLQSNFRMWVSCPQNHTPDDIEIFEEPKTNQNVRHSMRQNSSILQYVLFYRSCSGF